LKDRNITYWTSSEKCVK